MRLNKRNRKSFPGTWPSPHDVVLARSGPRTLMVLETHTGFGGEFLHEWLKQTDVMQVEQRKEKESPKNKPHQYPPTDR